MSNRWKAARIILVQKKSLKRNHTSGSMIGLQVGFWSRQDCIHICQSWFKVARPTWWLFNHGWTTAGNKVQKIMSSTVHKTNRWLLHILKYKHTETKNHLKLWKILLTRNVYWIIYIPMHKLIRCVCGKQHIWIAALGIARISLHSYKKA